MMIIAPVAIIAWIACEFLSQRNIRIAVGIIAIITSCGGAHILGGFGPSQELLFYQMSMGQVEKMIDHGDVSRLQEAFRQAKNHHVPNASYGGELWDALSKDMTNSEYH